jgi:MoaA/NifB/PqqE/SkfB family radical SAM enzyme
MINFNEKNIEKIINHLGKKKILDPTVSLCHHCHTHVPAYRFEEDNKIYLTKNCSIHGISTHLIELNAEFYHSLYKDYSDPRFCFNGGVLIETTDRCNLDCPHCYHLPDNDSSDVPRKKLIDMVKTFPLGDPGAGIHRIILAGAEPTLRPDFPELCNEISSLHSAVDCAVMTNGVRFNDKIWLRKSKDAGLVSVNIGLNHPSYHNHKIIRRKQETAISNIFEEGLNMGYISYTMIDLTELDYVLNEIITSPWYPSNFRVRLGSDIGRNGSKENFKLSSLYKAAEDWCKRNDKRFERISVADNNIYHVMVKIEDKTVRLIQWCDESNIDMEELRSGPWNYFVPHDGITNFLHQIIRRDSSINKKFLLIDRVPTRYQYSPNVEHDKSKLDLLKLKEYKI